MNTQKPDSGHLFEIPNLWAIDQTFIIQIMKMFDIQIRLNIYHKQEKIQDACC